MVRYTLTIPDMDVTSMEQVMEALNEYVDGRTLDTVTITPEFRIA